MSLFSKFLFRALLRLQPASVREATESEMREVIERRLSRAGILGRVRIWFHEFYQLARHRLRDRRARRARKSGGKTFMTDIKQDLHFAFRNLTRTPGLTLVVLLTLGLGIGSTTAAFSVVKGVLLSPLPFPNQDRMVAIWTRFIPESGFDFEFFSLSPPEYFDYREQTDVFDEVVAYQTTSTALTGAGTDPENIIEGVLTANAFDAFGVEPAIGRRFREEESVSGGPSVTILSYGMWRSYFGEDPDVIGTTINLDGTPAEIIGVMPEGFAFPNPRVSLWSPFRLSPGGNRMSHFLFAFGRLKEGMTIADARAELDPLMSQWESDYPEIHRGHFLVVRPLIDNYVSNVRGTLWLLLGSVGLVLLIVCVNVAGVLTARGEARLQEFAVRQALGASTGRLTRQLLTEYSLLGLIGAMVGAGLAYGGVRWLTGASGTGLPRLDQVQMDSPVLGFGLVVAVLATLLFGLAPAIHTARGNAAQLLRQGARSGSSRARHLFRRGIIVAETALAVVLTAGAGLLIRSFAELTGVESGIQPAGKLIAEVNLPEAGYENPEDANRFYEGLLSRLQSDPRVLSATAGSSIPYAETPGVWDFTIPGREPPGQGELAWNGHIVFVHDRYFETLGLPLLRGRMFNESDVAGSTRVALISESMERTFWPSEDPIGKQVTVDGPQSTGTIVGVVADVHWEGPESEPRPTRYFLVRQSTDIAPFISRSHQIAIHATVPPMMLVPTLREYVSEIDAGQPITEIQTLEAALASWVAEDRFVTSIMTGFALLALLLAAVGIYGVMAYSVARRSREIGIRMALGARAGQLAWSVVRQSLLLTLLGLGIGLLLTVAGGGAIRGLLYGVSATDPYTLGAVSAVLLLVSVTAAAIPAKRALGVDPISVLNEE